jgi:hypothetical protein
MVAPLGLAPNGGFHSTSDKESWSNVSGRNGFRHGGRFQPPKVNKTVELCAPDGSPLRGTFVDKGFVYNDGKKYSAGLHGPRSPPCLKSNRKRTFERQDFHHHSNHLGYGDRNRYHVDRVSHFDMNNAIGNNDNRFFTSPVSSRKVKISKRSPQRSFQKIHHQGSLQREIDFRVSQAIKNVAEENKKLAELPQPVTPPQKSEFPKLPVDKPLKIRTWRDANEMTKAPFEQLMQFETRMNSVISNLLMVQLSELNVITNTIKKVQALHDNLRQALKVYEHLEGEDQNFINYSKKCSDEIDEGLLHVWRGLNITRDQTMQSKSWFSSKNEQFASVDRKMLRYFKDQDKNIFNDGYTPPRPKHRDVVQEWIYLHKEWNKNAGEIVSESIPTQALTATYSVLWNIQDALTNSKLTEGYKPTFKVHGSFNEAKKYFLKKSVVLENEPSLTLRCFMATVHGEPAADLTDDEESGKEKDPVNTIHDLSRNTLAANAPARATTNPSGREILNSTPAATACHAVTPAERSSASRSVEHNDASHQDTPQEIEQTVLKRCPREEFGTSHAIHMLGTMRKSVESTAKRSPDGHDEKTTQGKPEEHSLVLRSVKHNDANHQDTPHEDEQTILKRCPRKEFSTSHVIHMLGTM